MCFPAELLLGFGGVGVTAGNVARSARGDFVGHLAAAGSFEGAHHFKDAIALSSAKVPLMGAG